MELVEYLKELQAEIREAELSFDSPGEKYPYPELVFAEKVMQHMSDIGMTNEPQLCYFDDQPGASTLRLSGYSFGSSDDDEAPDQLDLFVSLYKGVDEIEPLPQTEIVKSANQCMRFLKNCVNGTLEKSMDETNEAYPLVVSVRQFFSGLVKLRVFVITDLWLKNKGGFAPTEFQGKSIQLEVMDIERLFNHLQQNRPRDEVLVDFNEISGSALPCVWVPGVAGEYDYALTAIPGEALRFIYDKYGARVLEANVRSFLSATGKINKGIRDSLRTEPERFMAYNNGVVLVADEIGMNRAADGSPGILWLKGMQIVNGGQTTASLYFTKKKFPNTDLSKVRVPAKLIVLRSSESEELLISNISKYANSQNAVKASDLSANHPFHTEIEALAARTYCPDGVGRWYYERSGGSYKVMLEREGKTPARIKKLQAAIPPARKITKTDFAKFLNAWGQNPHMASLGGQKNFDAFMLDVDNRAEKGLSKVPESTEFKRMIAQVILFKAAQKLLRPLFPAFQGNVTIYTLSLFSAKVGSYFDLEMIWQNQKISPELAKQIIVWAKEVDEALHSGAQGRMISEWAKKEECWTYIKNYKYSPMSSSIPESKLP